jgi:CspA family cold shock protein
MQGVIKAYDPGTGSSDALVGSLFRMVRQGQRVIFDLDAAGRATRLRLGSEADMGTPGY